MSDEGIKFNRNNKFDIQLSEAILRERNLAQLLASGKIELKSETYQWKRTGNICIEFRQNGKKSGIAAVDDDATWIHQLYDDDGRTLRAALMFPVKRLKALCRKAYKNKQWRTNAGDGGRFDVVLLNLADLVKDILK